MTETKFNQSSVEDIDDITDRAARRMIRLQEHAKELIAAVRWMRQRTEDMIQEVDDG